MREWTLGWMYYGYRTIITHLIITFSPANLVQTCGLLAMHSDTVKCAYIKRTIKEKLERCSYMICKEKCHGGKHTASCFLERYAPHFHTGKSKRKTASLLLNSAKPHCLFLKDPRTRTFQHNIFHLLMEQAQKRQRQYKLHLQCSISRSKFWPREINFWLKRLINHLRPSIKISVIISLYWHFSNRNQVTFIVIQRRSLLITNKIDLKSEKDR